MSAARRHRSRRGSVIVIVLWAVAVTAIITVSGQLFAYRQATLGREAVERVQARWAARAGLEHMLAAMSWHTENPDPGNARALVLDMYYLHEGQTIGAEYNVLHFVEERGTLGGPMDEHSKFNVNNLNDRMLLLALDDMTPDILDALNDWSDADDQVGLLGAERDYYLGLEPSYQPRNGPLRSIAEFEMVAGVWPKYFRGEDWNLNNRLDVNENDGGNSLPPDEADDYLDAKWSGRLTVYSVEGGATLSGQSRIYLKNAEVETLEERLGLDRAQAEALLNFGANEQAELTDLLFTELGGGGATTQPGADQQGGQNGAGGRNPNPNGQPGQGGAANPNAVPPLTDDQLRTILAECTTKDPLDRVPGRININTVPAEFLRDMMEVMGMDEAVADELLYLRDSQAEGIRSLVELRSIPNMTTQTLRALVRRFDVVSNVFTVSSRGKSAASGLEVEIVAVVDRSTVPVKILEYREQ